MAKYMLSKSAGLLCRVTYKNKYEVVNGGWMGTRKDDILTVDFYPDRKITITDWEEVDPSTWSKEKQYRWYYRR